MTGLDGPAGPAAGADPNEADLADLARLVRGEPDALEGLYGRYGTMAYSIALRITGDAGTAEDAVQEAFLGAWRNAGRFVPDRGTVRTWLLAIVHHRAIDSLRRRRATVELPEESEGALSPSAMTLPDVWDDVAATLDRDAIRAALGVIPDRQREALELAYFGGLTQVEISERLTLPLGTVKSRMRLGLLALRAELTGHAGPAHLVSRAGPGDATEPTDG
ncbi:MAG TPA: sigma-70 family RNA polymerase sigma factor [Candidatus Limnocylindrales bacterium]|jgi:RNA polymerase sigma-70 factor (ECF subfamily)